MPSNQANFNLHIGTTADLKGVNEIKAALNELSKKALTTNMLETTEEINKVTSTVQSLQKALSNSFDIHLNTLNLTKFDSELKKANLDMVKVRQTLGSMGTEGSQAFIGLAKQTMSMNSILKESNTFMTTLSKSIGNTIRYQALNAVFRSITGSISEAYGYVKNLDNSLNRIQIVSEKSADSMKQFAKEANNAAQSLGAKTTDYTDASLIYYQQGLDDEAVKNRTDTTMKMSNVLGTSAAEVSDYMTAIWNNFDDGSKSLEYFGDVITNLGANTASSAEEIAEGLGKFAAVADTVGLSYEYATAALATVVAETRQSADTVGTAFKTLFARIQDLEQGNTLEDGTTLGKYSQALEKVGINIKDQTGELKTMDTILDEMGNKWSSLSKDQQVALAQNVAGTRQYTQLVALMDNWDEVKDNIDLANSSLGTLDEKQEIYMNSTKAHLSSMKAAWENLFDSMLNTDSINSFADASAKIANTLATVADSVGGLIPILTAIGGIGLNVFRNQLGNAINGFLTNMETAVNSSKNFEANLSFIKANYSSTALNTAVAGPDVSGVAKEAVRDMANSYSQIAIYRQSMSEEDLKTADNLIKQQGTLGEQLLSVEKEYNEWQKITEETTEFVDLLKMAKGHSDELTNFAANIKANVVDTQGLEEITKFKKFNKGTTKHKEIVENTIKNSLDESDANTAAQIKLKKELAKEIGNLKNVEMEATEVDGKYSYQIKLSEDATLSDVQAIQKLLEKYKEEDSELLGITAKLQGVVNAQEEARASAERMAKQQAFNKQFNDATRFAGGLMQVASAWNMLLNLDDIWNNEDLSAGEKFLQLTINLSMSLPMLANGFKSIAAGGKALPAVLLKVAAAMGSEGAAAAVAEGGTYGFGTALGIVGPEMVAFLATAAPLILLLTAIGIGAYALVKKYNEVADAERAAKEQAEELNKTYEESKQRYDELISTINSYEDGKKHIDELKSSTEEFRDAIEETNEKALELLDTYDGLTYHRDSKGLIQIDNLDEIKEAQRQAVSTSKILAYNAKIVANTASVATQTQRLQRNGTMGYMGLDDGKGGTKDYTKDLAVAVKEGNQDLINEIINARVDAYVGKDTRAQVAEEYSQEINRLKDDFISLGKTIEEVEEQNKLYAEEMALAAVQVSDKFKDYDPVIQAEVAKIAAEKVEEGDYTPTTRNKAIEELKKSGKIRQNDTEKFSEMFSDDEIKAWEEAHPGYTFVKNSAFNKTKGKFEYKDEETGKFKYTSIDAADMQAWLMDQEKAKNYKEEVDNSVDPKKYSGAVDNIVKQLGFVDKKAEKTKENLEKYLKVDGDEIFDFSGITYDDLEKLRDIDWKKALGEEPGQAVEDAINDFKYDFSNSGIADNISAAASLANILSSDKKLTKAQLEEKAGDESFLQSDYSLELYDFDNQSAIDQMEILDNIILDSIQNMDEYIQNARNNAEKEIRETEEKLAKENERYRELSEKKGKNQATEEELNEFEDLGKVIQEDTEYLKELGNVLLPEFFDNTIIDSFISGLDTVISKAELLQKISDGMGENWTVATKDVELFAETFPEIIANQENYNVLQDGSIQLSEQGKKVYNEKLEAEKAALEEEEKAYNIELRKQADIKLAQAEYYRDQAELLKEYLKDKSKGTEIETKLSERAEDYKNKLMEITGANEAELTEQMMQNMDKTAETAGEDCGDIWDDWVAVGECAEAAALAYQSKQFNNPSTRPGGGGGHAQSATKATFNSVSEIQDLAKMNDEEIQMAINTLEAKAEEAENKAGEILSRVLKSESQVKATANSINNATSGKGNSKGKEKETKDKKKYDDEFDRYHDLKQSIDELADAMSDLDKRQSHLFGRELAASLQNSNKLIQQQRSNYEALAAAQRQEMGEIQGSLAEYGVTFDAATGQITNYASATAAALAELNAAIDRFNNSAQTAADKKLLEAAEKNYEEFKKKIENYDKLVKDLRDTENKLDDLWYKEKENNLKAWEAVIKVDLDLAEAERSWKKFVNEMNKDFKSVFKDIRGEMKGIFDDFKELSKTGGSLDINGKAMQDIMREIDIMEAGGESSMFVSISEAQEKLKEYMKEYQSAVEELYDLYKEAWETYLEGIDQAVDKLDDVLDKYDELNDRLDHIAKINELLYGAEQYGTMADIYDAQAGNLLGQLDSLRQQIDFYEEQYNKEVAINGENSESAQKWKEAWDKALKERYDKEEQYIEAIQNKAKAQIKAQMADLEKYLTGGKGISAARTEWDDNKKKSEGYYDDVERVYQLESLEQKYKKAINGTSDIKAQQRIEALMQSQVKSLEDKTELSEYDVELAEKRLEVLQAQIALEDAQNNKNSMKLTRGADGNWSYQYVADEDDVMGKTQALLDKQNEVYEYVKENWNEINEEILEDTDEALRRINELYEASLGASEEVRNKNLAEIERIKDLYWGADGIITKKAKQAANIEQNLNEETANSLWTLYQIDETNYELMNEHEQALLDTFISNGIQSYEDLYKTVFDNYDLIEEQCKEVNKNSLDNWNSTVAEMVRLWNSDDGDSIKTNIDQALDSCEDALDDYIKAIGEGEKAAGDSFTNIVGQIQKVEGETDKLKDKTSEMVTQFGTDMDNYRQYLKDIQSAWDSVKAAAESAMKNALDYLKKIGEEAQRVTNMINSIPTSKPTSSPTSNPTTKTPTSPTPKEGKPTYRADRTGGGANFANWVVWKYQDGKLKDQRNVGTNPKDDGDDWQSAAAALRKAGEFKTGGYTGTWNGSGDLNAQDGKLAFLHQKELVLNADDTKNMLDIVNTVRGMASLGSSISDVISNSIANMLGRMMGLGTNIVNSNSSNATANGGNVFNITAEFPNANDVNEIREAILSLPNLASQYVNR